MKSIANRKQLQMKATEKSFFVSCKKEQVTACAAIQS